MAEMEPKKSNIVPFDFAKQIAYTASASTMKTVQFAGHMDNSEYVQCPWSGSVVGLAVYAEKPALTNTNTIKFWATAGGTTAGLAVSLSRTNTRYNYTAWRRGLYAVSAGDLLGVTYSSAATWAASSAGVFAKLFIQIEQNV